MIPNSHEEQKEVAIEARDLAQKARKAFLEVLELIKEVVKNIKAYEK